MRGQRRDGSGLRGLRGLRRFGNYQGGSLWGQAGIDEPAGDFGVVGTGHVNDDRGAWSDGDPGHGAGVFGAGKGGE